jgi:hypothetical protein
MDSSNSSTPRIPKLQGSQNWDIWSIQMEAILIERGYREVMTTPLPITILNPVQTAQRALATIRLNLANGPLLQTRHFTDPILLWNHLKELYEPKGFSSEFLMAKELFQTRLSNSQGGMEGYLNRISRLCNDLKGRNIHVPDQIIIAIILSNLTKEYDYTVTIITAGLRSTAAINLTAIYSQLIDESRRLKGIKNDQNSNNYQNSNAEDVEMAMATTQKGRRTREHLCEHCPIPGHPSDKCWFKHPHLRPTSRNGKQLNTQNSQNTSNSNALNSSQNGNSINNSIANHSTMDTSNSAEYSSTSEYNLHFIHQVSKAFNPNEWIIDSGGSIHISCEESYFSELQPIKQTIQWGNNAKSLVSTGRGTIKAIIPSTNRTVTISNVLYIPELGVNLLSVGALIKNGATFNFGARIQITLNSENSIIPRNTQNSQTQKCEILAEGYYKHNLAIIELHPNASISYINVTNSYNLWHKRMGHIGQNAMKALGQNTEGPIISFQDLEQREQCDICPQASMSSSISRNPRNNRGTYYGEFIHSDIGGAINPKTYSGYRYYITFIDDKTKYSTIRLLKNKDEAVQASIDFIKWLNTQNKPNPIKRFHSDNGGEYKALNKAILKLGLGIEFTYSATYSPQQNGVAERMNRTLMDKTRALLIQANLPKQLWGEAISAAIYLFNRTPNSTLSFKTPFELAFGKKPDISEIRIWGSLIYKKNAETKGKLEPRASSYYLIGYIAPTIYKLFDLKSKKTTTSRDIIVHEGKFNNIQNGQNQDLEESRIPEEPISIESEDELDYSTDNAMDTSEDELANPTITKPSKSTKIKKCENSKMGGIKVNAQNPKNATEFNDTINHYILASNSILEDPNSYNQAISSPHKTEWNKAMEAELATLNQFETWNLVPRPKNKPILKGRWVYKTKLNANNTIQKYKARWVAKGYLQEFGVNYFDTFAGTLKPTAYRLLLILAINMQWIILQWDVKSAFPNAAIDTEIYIEQPHGFATKDSDGIPLVCLLNKALYGLKQAGRQWLVFLANLLAKLGFIQISADTAIFVHRDKNIIIAVYVDDFLIFAKNEELATDLYKQLSKDLEVTNLGPISYYLGIELIKSQNSLILTQRGFLQRLLQKFNKQNLKPHFVPSILGDKLIANTSNASTSQINQFQQEIGSLIYLAINTRPDITQRVFQLARFMSNPSKCHFRNLDYLWGYLNNSINYGLYYSINSAPLDLIGYSDADWGGDYISRRSTTGYLFYFNNSLISWTSKLQHTVALSSCEAEYMALRDAVKEQLFIKSLISQLPKQLINAINTENTGIIYTDSQSAMALANNPVQHNRTKHIDIQYHFVRQNVLDGRTQLLYHPTESLVADGLTKPLANPKHLSFLAKLGLRKIE